jgi:cell division transport system permease protein
MDARDLRRLMTATRSGLRGLRRTPLVFALSVATMAAGLLMLSAYLLVLENMRGVLANAGQDLSITAFMAVGENPQAETVEELQVYFEALVGVDSVTFIDPERALQRLRSDLGAESVILDDLVENPLPASFEIRLKPAARGPEEIRELSSKIARVEGVEDVRYGEAWVEAYARLLRALEWIGAGLGACLFVVLAVIVAGTIRLAVYARADEIQIQRLVGGGGFFVRLPFYLEGALQGALGAVLALSLLYGIFQAATPAAGDALQFVLGHVSPVFFGALEVSGLLCLGVMLGVGGAALSLARLEESP